MNREEKAKKFLEDFEKLPEAEQMFVAGIAEGMRISMETTPEEPTDRTE